jgi:hypothetical protein
MKVSELQLTGEKILVDTNKDSQRIIHNTNDLRMYIEDFGDLVIVFDPKHKRYNVPAFAKAQQIYNETASAHCAEWGCE